MCQSTAHQRAYAQSLSATQSVRLNDLPAFRIQDHNVDIAERLGVNLNVLDTQQSLFKPMLHTPETTYCFKCGDEEHVGLQRCRVRSRSRERRVHLAGPPIESYSSVKLDKTMKRHRRFEDADK